MASLKRTALALGLVAAGYVLGSTGLFTRLQAQEAAGPSEEATKKIVEVNDKLKAAVDALKLESRYEAATKGINPYAVLVGGLNVKDDLESGNGVDPETFAALYVAAYDIKKLNLRDESLADWINISELDYDAEGRLMYRNKVIRIYPVSRLKKLRAMRMVLNNEIRPDSK